MDVRSGTGKAKTACAWSLWRRADPMVRDSLAVLDRRSIVDALHISHGHRFVYVNNPKSGCSSIKRGLLEFEFDLDGEIRPHDEARARFAHLGDRWMLRPLHALADQGYRFVTFVRDPYDRLVSSYHSVRRRRWAWYSSRLGIDPTSEFDGFVRAVCAQTDRDADSHWRAQSSQVLYDVIPYDFVGRTEQMAHDWRTLFTTIGAAPSEIPPIAHQNRSTGSDSVWTDDLRALVAERFAADFRNFGYQP